MLSGGGAKRRDAGYALRAIEQRNTGEEVIRSYTDNKMSVTRLILLPPLYAAICQRVYAASARYALLLRFLLSFAIAAPALVFAA